MNIDPNRMRYLTKPVRDLTIKSKELVSVENKVIEIMEVLTKSTDGLHMKYTPQDKDDMDDKQKEDLAHNISEFGTLLEKLHVEFREHYNYVGEKAIVPNLDLPIDVKNFSKATVDDLWADLFKSSVEQTTTEGQFSYQI